MFLDLDGTLARIEPRPDDVGPHARRTSVLKRLAAAADGRVAVVSGRSLTTLDHLLEGALIAASGVHGLERRRADGSLASLPPHPGIPRARRAFAQMVVGRQGLMMEDKGLSVTLHYRLAPDAAEAVVALARREAEAGGLALQLGDMVAELKTPGADKGSAIQAFMQEPPFAGRAPVFVGDDLTDEDGFRAVAALGGYGVLVGEGRETAARYRLADPDAVLDWLEAGLSS